MSRHLRDAARSCNEWRDTLFCTALLAVGVAAAEWQLPVTPSYLLWGVVVRELIRGLAWQNANQKFALTALVSTVVALLTRDAALAVETGNLNGVIASNAVSIGMLLAVMPVIMAYSGGLRGTYSAYRKTLFDWPRKLCPPRKPNKRRVVEQLFDAWRGLADAAGPVAKPSPVIGR